MKFLITGHTGFKGSWLCIMLKLMGHQVVGVALNPLKSSLFNEARVSQYLDADCRINITNIAEMKRVLGEHNPDVIIHLAAQSLVKRSFLDPVDTYNTNVFGTLNILEGTRQLSNLKATLIVTTDKVYKNKNRMEGYQESDELGGQDPYSASKAAADIATQSWRASYGRSPVSIARAGNVIGGGDWAENRLIPDVIRALQSDSILRIRYPNSIRPWQHVLDCLQGYLTLVDAQLQRNIQGEWNFGPLENSQKTVTQVIELFGQHWGRQPRIEIEDPVHEESMLLTLNSSKARMNLEWKEKFGIEETLEWTADWYRHLNPERITQIQVEKFLEL